MSTASKPKTASLESSVSYLLICGYIRESEQVLHNRIIPDSICTLCWKFYYFHNLLFCLCCKPTHAESLRIADIHVNHIALPSAPPPKQPEHSNCKLIHHEHVQVGSLFITHCCATNQFDAAYFPPPVVNTHFNAWTTSVLFKCGGWPDAFCHALFVDTNTFNVYNWKLPPIDSRVKSQPYGNSITFSSKDQRLLSIGGNGIYGDALLALEFRDDHKHEDPGHGGKDEHDEQHVHANDDDEEKEQEWSWRHLDRLPCHRYNSSAVMLDHGNRLLVAGGKEKETNLNTVVLYDFGQAQWSELASFVYGRRAAGVYCDQFAQRVYLGGGIEDEQCAHSVEWYDVHKNAWNLMQIPRTRFSHQLHPVMWLENSYMLYIASVCNTRGYGSETNCCEWIDLREDKKAWNTLIETDLLKEVFGFSGKLSTDDVYLVSN